MLVGNLPYPNVIQCLPLTMEPSVVFFLSTKLVFRVIYIANGPICIKTMPTSSDLSTPLFLFFPSL